MVTHPMKLKTTFAKGFTLVEVSVAIMITAILASTAYFVMADGLAEQRDAAMVQSVHATLQQVISQGSVRQDVDPTNLNPVNVIGAARDYLSQGASGLNEINLTGGPVNYSVTLQTTNRVADFTVANSGDVRLVNLNGFTQYEIENDVIKKK